MYRISPSLKNVFHTAGDFFSTFITSVTVLVAIAFIVIKLIDWNLFSVDSSSMSPQYPVHSLVVVQKTAPEKIKIGDVITYVLNEDGVLVTHRVAAISSANQSFITKGDANSAEDAAPVLWENVVGKVVLGIPWLGRPFRFLTAQENRPIVISAIAALFVFSLGWDLFSRRSRKKRSCI